MSVWVRISIRILLRWPRAYMAVYNAFWSAVSKFNRAWRDLHGEWLW